MTGGYQGAFRINRELARVCREEGLALGVGSQRQALEQNDFHRTFSIVREEAPEIPIIGNLGASEVASLTSVEPVRSLARLIGADAFAIHLNPLQEFLQPEGKTNFRGVLNGIRMLAQESGLPIIVKEVGAGISAEVAERLLAAGVSVIDVAGAGGTSWAGVEALRTRDRSFAERFWDWGIPTAEALREVNALRARGSEFTLIASGGITSGLDAAKCLALGADLVGSARPMLKALKSGGVRGLRALVQDWKKELRGIMFLTGSATIAALRSGTLRQSSHQ
jgi:isopentenyl-diphosphate delta-isomerase